MRKHDDYVTIIMAGNAFLAIKLAFGIRFGGIIFARLLCKLHTL